MATCLKAFQALSYERLQAALSELFGLTLSQGRLMNLLRRAQGRFRPGREKAAAPLRKAEVVASTLARRSAMHRVRIYATTDSMLDFDVRHIPAALGAKAIACSWMVSRVAGHDEAFDAAGEQAGRLEELATSGTRITGDRL